MTITDKHIALVEAVNNATTEQEHRECEIVLNTFRETLSLLGHEPNLMACDMHYLSQGIDRPMCCGVFLDWAKRA